MFQLTAAQHIQRDFVHWDTHLDIMFRFYWLSKKQTDYIENP